MSYLVGVEPTQLPTSPSSVGESGTCQPRGIPYSAAVERSPNASSKAAPRWGLTKAAHAHKRTILAGERRDACPDAGMR